MILFTGDPRIFIDENGASLKFIGGQPVMDAGLENAVIISLFTAVGYWGNLLETEASKKLGSDFEEVAKLPITVSNMNKLRRSAESALKWLTDTKIVEKIVVDVFNPAGYRKDVRILLTPPGKNASEVLLSVSGKNWIFQAENPAYVRGN